MKNVKWKEFVSEAQKCQDCKGLLDKNAFPVFMKNVPLHCEILFILEAPNRDDTYNPSKKYLTIDSKTDPSGTYFYELFRKELGFNDHQLFVTNSVLCLPDFKNGNYPVTAKQRNNCSYFLKNLILNFNPLIVCTLGTKALKATSIIKNHPYEKMSEAVGKKLKWFGRYLYPLYHTSPKARNPRNGRIEKLQREDWSELRQLYDELTCNNK